jgi:hypothetical protein
MPTYTVQITPDVFETVEANSPEEARRKVDQLIADKGTRNIYDKLYFDYDTGVNKRGIRRKLALAEVGEFGDERETILDRIVGSSNHLKNTKNQIAITPDGMRILGLKPKSIQLADGTIIEQNTVVDERGFDLRGDLADFAGIAGPLVGSLQFLRPQSKILNFFKNQPRFGRISAVAAGSAAGKGVEEAVETLRGVQEQDLGQVARTLSAEALLGAGGQIVGEGFGGIYSAYFGKRIPLDDGRLLSAINDGYNADDILRLQKDLGKFPNQQQIKDAVANGVVRITGAKYVPGQKTTGAEIPGRIQAATETVFGNKRIPEQRDYFLELFGGLQDDFGKYAENLDRFVSQSTRETISDQVITARNALYNKEQNIVDTLDNLVKKTIDDAVDLANPTSIPSKAEFGVELAQALGTARTASQAFIKTKYNGVKRLFDDLTETKPGASELDLEKSKTIKSVISDEFKEAKKKAARIFKEYTDKFKNAKNLDPNYQNLKAMRDAFEDLDFTNPDLEFVRDLDSLASTTRVLFMKSKSPARKAYTELKRLLDNFDSTSGKYRDGESILKNLELNSLENISTKIAEKNSQRIADGLPPIRLNTNDQKKIENAVKELRKANKTTYDIESIFDKIPEDKIVKDATKGAFDGDDVFETLVMKGQPTRLQSVFRALREFEDNIKDIPNGSKYLDDLPYKSPEKELKGKIKQRLFADFIEDSTDYGTDTINIQTFARKIKSFDERHKNKLDDILTDSETGINLAPRLRVIADQLVRLNPKLKPDDLLREVQEFASNSKGLSELETSQTFFNKLTELAEASSERLTFLANRTINELPEKSVEEITDVIFRPNAGTNIDKLKTILSPEAFESVKKTSMQRILEKSIDINGKGSINDILKPGRLKIALDSYGDDTLDAMFGTEVRQSLRNIHKTMDLATFGEVGRGGGAGTLVAATIAINAFNINMLPTVIGLGIMREIFSNPAIVKLLAKRDKGSIARVLSAFAVALRQAGIRGLQDTGESLGESISGLAKDEDVQAILQPTIESINETSNMLPGFQLTQPSTPIELPEVEAPAIQSPLNEDRLAFAERLAGRPVI